MGWDELYIAQAINRFSRVSGWKTSSNHNNNNILASFRQACRIGKGLVGQTK